MGSVGQLDMATNTDTKFESLTSSPTMESLKAQLRDIQGDNLQRIRLWKVKADNLKALADDKQVTIEKLQAVVRSQDEKKAALEVCFREWHVLISKNSGVNTLE